MLLLDTAPFDEIGSKIYPYINLDGYAHFFEILGSFNLLYAGSETFRDALDGSGLEIYEEVKELAEFRYGLFKAPLSVFTDENGVLIKDQSETAFTGTISRIKYDWLLYYAKNAKDAFDSKIVTVQQLM